MHLQHSLDIWTNKRQNSSKNFWLVSAYLQSSAPSIHPADYRNSLYSPFFLLLCKYIYGKGEIHKERSAITEPGARGKRFLLLLKRLMEQGIQRHTEQVPGSIKCRVIERASIGSRELLRKSHHSSRNNEENNTSYTYIYIYIYSYKQESYKHNKGRSMYPNNKIPFDIADPYNSESVLRSERPITSAMP